jgi:hypothetical protein
MSDFSIHRSQVATLNLTSPLPAVMPATQPVLSLPHDKVQARDSERGIPASAGLFQDPAREALLDRPIPVMSTTARSADIRDQRVYDAYLDAQRQLLTTTNATEPLDLTAMRPRLVDQMLRTLSPGYHKLLPDQQRLLFEILSTFSPAELVAAEVQGEGGREAQDNVTTSGKAGHYTHAALTSVVALLDSGRLSPEVMNSLQQLQTQPLAPELAPARTSLMRSVLQEVAFPEDIGQYARSTCAPATVQMLLAIKNPARYMGVVGDLASPEGRVRPENLAASAQIVRETDTLGDDRSGRSLSSRLMQPALMEWGNGADDYDNQKDLSSGLFTRYAGLSESGAVRLTDALLGKGSHRMTVVVEKRLLFWDSQSYLERPDFMAKLEAAVNGGEPVPTGLQWGDSGHKVLTTRIDRTQQLAYFLNPWGELNTLPLAEFERRVDSASMPQSEPGAQDALSLLTEPANDPTAYLPLSRTAYYSMDDYFAYDPQLADLSKAQQNQLLASLQIMGLSGSGALSQLETLSQQTLDTAFFKALDTMENPTDLATYLEKASQPPKATAEPEAAILT